MILFRLACLLGLAMASSGAARAQEAVDASRKTAIVRAVERVAPAVVTVNVLEVHYEQLVDPFFREFFRFFDVPRPFARIRERPVRSVGSGFILDARGHIVTNYHVVEGADSISVTLPDGRGFEVKLAGADARTDIAVLRADGNDLPHVTLGNSDDLLIGEWLIAIGNPFGLMVDDPQPSVSVGVCSANRRRVSRDIGGGERMYQDMIQTDAAINPGNSGGPLVNANGEVVGVNTFIFSQSGGSVGLGFAIPINRVRRVADEIIQFGRRRDPWPGFRVVGSEQGVAIYEIYDDTPAYAAGLRPGDIILAINDRTIGHPSDVDFVFWGLFVGDTATMRIRRDGRERTVSFPIRELRTPRR